MTQETALKILKTGANVFLTGEPGSGKSHTTREYIDFLRACGVEPAITASTGIAATHIHGMTIHSWSGIGIKKNLTKYDIETIAEKSYIYKRIERTNILIIDEVSMLDAGTLESADLVCREAKRNPMEAFGGMQVIFVGDFFQLPPISRDNEVPTSFAFDSQTWRDANPLVCYLHEQHRQDDKDYLSVLSAIRKNSWSDIHKDHIKSRLGEHADVAGHIPRLFSHNEDVDRINQGRIDDIEGESVLFEMESVGKDNLVESLKRGCLSPAHLELKAGSVVMCTKNNLNVGFVNGTLGEITGFNKETGYPIIKTKNGRKIEIEPMEWSMEENGKIKARIVQIPLRLAWAITIHKSQGMSMDAAVMNLSDVFEYGQGYVALSRVRRLSGLYLLGYNDKSLKVHPQILAKDIEFKKGSAGAREKFEKMDSGELVTMHKNFVTALGGDYVSDEARAKSGKKTKGKSRGRFRSSDGSVPKSTQDETAELLTSGKNISEIATARGLKEGTVIDHITELLTAEKITQKDLSHIVPKEKKLIAELSSIHSAFKTLGADKLKPIFDHFHGIYSYDTLRLARLLYSGK